MLERYVFRMYTVKAICEVLLQPLVTAALVAAIAFILRLTRQVNAAHVLGAVAISIAFLSSLSPVSDALLRPLEGAYPPLGDGLAVSNAAFIVVLGSAYHPFEGIPITSAISDEGMVRIVEGIRLARAYHLQLVVSGGAAPGYPASALGYAELARALGVAPNDLTVSAVGVDTHTEAVAIARVAGSRPFILVTSASHMPRAMALLRRAGAAPLAAPTGQRAFAVSPPAWRQGLPSAVGLHKTEMALHEYFGLLAIYLGLD
jgi:uncharacterized SAM-binding protein YcdF (DUF218 family)